MSRRVRMRLYAVSVLIAVVVMIPNISTSETVSTINELVTLYDVEGCKECHSDIASNWKNSYQARSAVSPAVLSSIKSNITNSTRSKKIELVRACFSCHAPQIKDASDELVEHITELIIMATDEKVPAKRENAKRELSKLNINCRICHMVKGMPEGKISPNIIYGAGWSEHNNNHMEEYGFDTLKSEYLLSESFCTSCHRNSYPDIPTAIYSSLHKKCSKQFTANDENRACHDCHMDINHNFPKNLNINK